MMAIKVQPCVFALRLKVKAEAYDWLNAAATEVNQVWNYAKIGDVSSLKLAKTRMANAPAGLLALVLNARQKSAR